MKAVISQVLVVLACMGLVSLVGAQTASQGTGASKEMPREACRAVETYVATIDSAQAQLDAAKRVQQYDQAKAQLEPVLKRFGKESVMIDAARYATYVETIVKKDATDAQLAEAMDKRLKLRAQLLGLCDSFTATRQVSEAQWPRRAGEGVCSVSRCSNS